MNSPKRPLVMLSAAIVTFSSGFVAARLADRHAAPEPLTQVPVLPRSSPAIARLELIQNIAALQVKAPSSTPSSATIDRVQAPRPAVPAQNNHAPARPGSPTIGKVLTVPIQ